MTSLKLHKYLPDTAAEGFGRRFCIWVQGCTRHCPGCMAQDTWDPAAGFEMETAHMIKLIQERARQVPPLEGITFLGGEPFEQAAGLCELAKAARALNLSVITFTGYTLEVLMQKADPSVNELLSYTDLLIDGPYMEDLRDFSRPWVGSLNQRFIFRSGRYSMADIEREKNHVEIRIKKDGSVIVNGMADFEKGKRNVNNI